MSDGSAPFWAWVHTVSVKDKTKESDLCLFYIAFCFIEDKAMLWRCLHQVLHIRIIFSCLSSEHIYIIGDADCTKVQTLGYCPLSPGIHLG